MVTIVRHIILLLPIAFSHVAFAQTDAFARVKLNRSSVYPEQPIKATITVYTATWFTSPIDFEDIQVDRAFVLPFKRTLSSMRKVNNKQYASLEFYYLIYPFESGNYEFPSMTLSVETPPTGEYKGIKVSLNTKAVSFKVNQIPDDYTGDDWFVANNVQIQDRWNKPLNELKVGDVLERTVTISASGTLPNFIPELTFDENDFGSVYPKGATIEDTRDSKSANGKRTEKVVYLLEKEGTYTIPPVRVDWWNPYSNKVLYREVPSIDISIADNPDLGILRTLQDSLANDVRASQAAQDTEPLRILGLKPWEAGALLILVLLALRLLIPGFNRWAQNRMKHNEQRRLSEQYLFRKIGSTPASSGVNLLNQINTWWDAFERQHDAPITISEAIHTSGSDLLKNQWHQLELAIHRQEMPSIDFKSFTNELNKLRSQLLTRIRDTQNISNIQSPWTS